MNEWSRTFNEVTTYCPKIVIAQVHGWVVGMATQIVESADLAIAGESLHYANLEQRIGFAGFLPFPTILHRLIHVGPKRAREMVLMSKQLTAQEAMEWGLVNTVVPDAELDEETLRWARAVAMHSTDGLINGKMQLIAAMENMGMGSLAVTNMTMHALFTNLKWRKDELNWLKSRYTEGGMAEGFKAREAKWIDKTGF